MIFERTLQNKIGGSNIARNKEFIQQEVIRKASELFWQKGYKNTSIQDLVDFLGLGRGSIYNAFGNKHALFLEVLEDYIARRNDSLIKKLKKTPVKESFEKYMYEIIDEVIEDPNNKGCLIVNTMTELAATDDDVKRILLKSEEQLVACYEEALQYGVDHGEFVLDYEIHQIACFISNTIKGLRIVSKVEPIRERLESSVMLALTFLKKA